MVPLLLQVLDQNGEPMFEVDYKEARKMFSPTHIAVSIYKKMLGRLNKGFFSRYLKFSRRSLDWVLSHEQGLIWESLLERYCLKSVFILKEIN